MAQTPENSFKVPATEQVAQWIEHDKKLLDEGAYINDLGHFTVTASQEDRLHSEMGQTDTAQSQTVGAGIDAAGQREMVDQSIEQSTEEESNITEKEREKIQYWLAEGLITMHTWLGRNNIDRKNASGENRYMTVVSNPERASRVAQAEKQSTPEFICEELASKGISELVTVNKLGGREFSVINKAATQANEPAVLITYETLASRTRGKYFVQGGGGNAIIHRMQIFLPESEANTAIKMIEANPSFIREIAETFMSETLQAGEAWDKARPKYEDWEKANGGINRIAIREGFTSKPETSKVVEF